MNKLSVSSIFPVIALAIVSISLQACGGSGTANSPLSVQKTVDFRVPQSPEENIQIERESIDLISQVENSRSISKSPDGTFVLTQTRANALSPEAKAFAEQSIAAVNQGVKAGAIKISDDLKVNFTAEARGRYEIERRYGYWWGWTFLMNDYYTSRLANDISLGSVAVGGILGSLFGGVVGAAIGGAAGNFIGALPAWYINDLNLNHKGIAINIRWYRPAVWLNSR